MRWLGYVAQTMADLREERRQFVMQRAVRAMAAVPADTCVLVADQGIGDHFLVGAFAAAVEAHHKTKVWLAGSPRLAFLADLFPAVRKYVPCPDGMDREPLGARSIYGGLFFYAHFPGFELMRAVGYRDFHFLDAYRCRLSLPPGCMPTAARPPSEVERSAADALLVSAGLPLGRTVVLCSQARSTPMQTRLSVLWVKLAGELRARGFEPVLNDDSQAPRDLGIRRLSIPIRGFRAVAMSAGSICTVRSGLSDLVADLSCRQVVVFADVPFWAGPLHVGATLSKHGLEKSPLELVVRDDNFEEAALAAANHLGPQIPV